MKLRKYRKGEKYFFQIIDEQGDINLQSEGYETKEARDQGIEAARPKNGEIEKAETSGAKQKDGGEAYATDGKSDDYKPMGFYKKYGGNTVDGFDSFEAEGESYFSYRLDGEIYLISEGYKSSASRENGIKSVEKNLPLEKRYEYKQHPNGKYFFNLKAGNNQEIATSIWFDSQGDMNQIIERLKNGGQALGNIATADNVTNLVAANRIASVGVGERPEPLEAKPKKKRKKRTTTPKPKAEKVYLSTGNYHFNDVKYQLFRSGNGKHYFTFKNVDDKTILLNSNVRGFETEEQGLEIIQEVLQFAPYEVNYEGKMTRNGKYYFYLKNNKGENIAKSFFFDTEEKMQITIGSLLGSAAELKTLGDEKNISDTEAQNDATPVTPAVTQKAKNIDEYLDCAIYKSHIDKIDPDNSDFINFQENGEYYFAWVNEGDIVMRSEGYTSESAMKNGIASVIKNRTIEARFSVIEEEGKYFTILKAGNHQEIARSCPKIARNAALYWLPSQVAQREESRLALIKAEEIKMKEEEAKLRAAAELKQKEEEAKLRAAAELKQKEEEAKLRAAAELKQKEEEVVKIATAAAIVAKKAKRQDDYLECKFYKGHTRSTEYPEFSLFEEEGEYYFAMLDQDDEVVLRSEGYKSIKGRENGINSVIKNREIDGRYSTVEKSGNFYVVLKAGNNQEIGRSCPYKDKSKALGFITPAAAMIATAVPLAKVSNDKPAKVAVAAATPVIASTKKAKPVKVVTTANKKPEPIGVSRGSDGGGFKWWWLLPLLLLPLLWLFLKGCDTQTDKIVPAPVKVEAPTSVAAPTPKPAKVVEPVELVEEVVKAAAPVVAGCNCGEKDIAIFNIPNIAPKNITKLGSFPEFGNSHALSPSEFYDKLSNRYNSNPADKAYLDYIFKSMGYRRGFSDASSNLFSNVVLDRGTKGLLGFGEFHGYSYSTLNTSEMDRRAFKIKANNGCDIHFMKTCGNYMFFCE